MNSFDSHAISENNSALYDITNPEITSDLKSERYSNPNLQARCSKQQATTETKPAHFLQKHLVEHFNAQAVHYN